MSYTYPVRSNLRLRHNQPQNLHRYGVVTLRTAPTDRSDRSDLARSEQFRRIDRSGRGIGRSGRGIGRSGRGISRG